MSLGYQTCDDYDDDDGQDVGRKNKYSYMGTWMDIHVHRPSSEADQRHARRNERHSHI